MDDNTRWVDPREIVPPHEARDVSVLGRLDSVMRESGWDGRPLLVVESADGRLVAWTGSHRIAAAMSAELEAVPCYIISEQEIMEHGHSADETFVADYERLEVIRKLGDETATSLMWSEGRID